MQALPNSEQTNLTAGVLQLLSEQNHLALQEQLASMHPTETVQVLESVPALQRSEILGLMEGDQKSLILPILSEVIRAQVINEMDAPQIAQVVEPLNAGQLADLLSDLPDAVTESITAALDADNLARLNLVLDYPDGTAGRIMSTDALSVRPEAKLSVVLRWLRKQSSLPPYTTALMVTDSGGQYLGKLPMSFIVTGNLEATVESVMQPSREIIRASASAHDVARLFDQRHLVSVAVLDDADQLLGRITVDHAMTILRQEADRALLQSAGLKEEADLFAPVVKSVKQRGVWLGINLLTVLLAAWIIGLFQNALDQLVLLAVLMPIVASMGGIAGSQTLTLTIRGLALNQIVNGNVRWLATKELGIGALNGIMWAVVVAVATFLWFHNAGLSLVIAAAMMLNLIAAAASGVAVPLTLKRMGIDPALSGAVVLTTVTDIVGYLSFLGLASLFLL